MKAKRLAAWALGMAAVGASFAAEAKSGFYVGLGVGGAIVDGSENISVRPRENVVSLPPSSLVTTQFGEGLGVLFRFGYNILGMVAIEAAFSGNVDPGGAGFEGQGHAHGAVVIHPLGILDFTGVLSEDVWDPYLLVGGGASYGAYETAVDSDSKGWFAADFVAGIGLNAHILPFMSLGLDVRFIVPFYEKWIFNFDDGIDFEPNSDQKSLVVLPTINATFHVF
jgi:hypothetical protein